MQVCSMVMIMMFILDHLELTTCHKPTAEDQQQQDQMAVNKPPAILDYNKNMGTIVVQIAVCAFSINYHAECTHPLQKNRQQQYTPGLQKDVISAMIFGDQDTAKDDHAVCLVWTTLHPTYPTEGLATKEMQSLLEERMWGSTAQTAPANQHCVLKTVSASTPHSVFTGDGSWRGEHGTRREITRDGDGVPDLFH
ncbi:uncharacterized protein LOC143293343 [Babylonia areolata]|uniref:uncharacterized protein LOC143293343 n=1 Tax=Babylonia areolata TaxID=304850 RepID=UPI003FD5D1B0